MSNPPPQNKRKPPPESLDPSTAGPPAKRRTSGADSMIARDILPKPASNHGSPSFNPSQPTAAPKKRGRPSKAAVERRQAEAIARGEVIPPKTLTPKPEKQGGVESVGGYPPIAPMGFPGPASERPPQASFESRPYASPVEGSPGKKKRARPGSRPAKVYRLIAVVVFGTNQKSQLPQQGESSFPALGSEPSHAELGEALQATIPRDSVPISEPGGSGMFRASSHPPQVPAPVSSGLLMCFTVSGIHMGLIC